MPDIGVALAETVIFLYSPDANPKEYQRPIGSAFIIGYPVEGKENTAIPLVVTCRHVIGDFTSVLGRYTLQSGKGPGMATYDLAKLRESNDLLCNSQTVPSDFQ